MSMQPNQIQGFTNHYHSLLFIVVFITEKAMAFTIISFVSKILIIL